MGSVQIASETIQEEISDARTLQFVAGPPITLSIAKGAKLGSNVQVGNNVTLLFSTGASISGSLTVQAGGRVILESGAGNVLASTSSLTVLDGGFVNVTGNSQTLGNLKVLSGGSIVSSGSAATIKYGTSTFTANLPPNTPVGILVQPVNAAVIAGSLASLSVSATGSAPLTYQWYRNGDKITGGTSASYRISSAQALDSGSYNVLVSNAINTVNSGSAFLSVNTPVTITTQPANLSVITGSIASLSVSATGTAPLSYQWRKSGANIEGATSATFTLPNAQTTDAGSYNVVVSNAVSSLSSGSASLAVSAPVSILTAPGSLMVVSGSLITLSVSATGTAPLTYQWYKNGFAISGANTASYSIASSKFADSGEYWVVVSNNVSSLKSASFNVSVLAAPSIVTQPVSQAASLGDSVTLSAEVTGSTPMTFEWRKDGASVSTRSSETGEVSLIGGKLKPTLTIPNLQANNLGVYSLKATNSVGSVTSGSVAVLAWLAQPTGGQLLGSGSLMLSGSISAGSASFAYQWYRNGVKVVGATKATLQVTGTTAGGVYQLEASALGATVRSKPATVYSESALMLQVYSAMKVKDYAGAKTQLAKVVAAEAQNLNAKLLSSIVDLYLLTADSATLSILQKLGFTGSWDPWNFSVLWNAFPAGASSVDAKNWIKNTLYPKLQAVDTALLAISDPYFTAEIPESLLSPTATGWVSVDYGDAQALRAALNGVMGLCKWLETLNTDADLAALQSDRGAGKISVESFLTKFPTILAASSTASAAQTELLTRFTNALNAYKLFSNFASPASTDSGVKRLAPNLGAVTVDGSESIADEQTFRAGVEKALLSLGATTLAAGTQTFADVNGKTLRVNPKAFLSHGPGWRDFAPQFSRNQFKSNTLSKAIILSVLPDVAAADFTKLDANLLKTEPAISSWLLTRDDQTPPTLTPAAGPLDSNKILLGPDTEGFQWSGTITDESDLLAVNYEWKGGVL